MEGEVAVGKTRGSRWRKAERAMVMVQGAAEGGRHKTAQERMKKEAGQNLMELGVWSPSGFFVSQFRSTVSTVRTTPVIVNRLALT